MDRRLTDIFPPLGVRITSGPLELRGISDVEVVALLQVVQDGVHPADRMPFTYPWTQASPEELPLNYFQWWARGLATWSHDAWGLDLCVVWEGEVVGVQGVATRDFLTLHYGETGSWLGQRFQGRGIGTAITSVLTGTALREGHSPFLSAATQSAVSVYEKVGYTRVGTACIATGNERG